MSRLDEIRKIGFNSSVNVGKRNLHVQTEVLVRGQIVIRTMVLEGGTIVSAERRTCPEHVQAPEQVEAYVRQHHQDCIKALASNEAI